MAFNPADYHPDWKNIARQIREQAGNKCEFCGVPNGAHGARDRHGKWHDWPDYELYNSDVGWSLWPDGPPDPVRIVLTTAHLCWKTCADKKCIDPTHLRSLCQRCHLNWDREHHIEVQRRNREEKRGQLRITDLPLFSGTEVDRWTA